MLAKLLALLAATKGATVAAVVVLGAATVTVGRPLQRSRTW